MEGGGQRREGEEISHLLFVDDTLVFCGLEEDQMTNLCWILMEFEALSCLKVNVEKSEFIPVGRVYNIEDLVGTFGCRVGALPSTYLGLPFGAPFN